MNILNLSDIDGSFRSSCFIPPSFFLIASGVAVDMKLANWAADRLQIPDFNCSIIFCRGKLQYNFYIIIDLVWLSIVGQILAFFGYESWLGSFRGTVKLIPKAIFISLTDCLSCVKTARMLVRDLQKGYFVIVMVPDNGFFELFSDCSAWSTRFTIHIMTFNKPKVLQFWLITSYNLSKNDVTSSFTAAVLTAVFCVFGWQAVITITAKIIKYKIFSILIFLRINILN